jgi:uncharacterized protein YecE (DUF72 family)
LPFFADRFQTVEVNNTFYNLPKANVFSSWRRRSADDFIFALKMSRYLTHIKRLRDPREPVERFMTVARGLGSKLGPVLLQLPPNLRADSAALRETLAAFPSTVRLAVEFRDDSWYTSEIQELLREREASLCLADRDEKTLTPLWRTADWGYLRMHSGVASPASCYSHARLEHWARELAKTWDDDADVFVYFNNDPHGCAIRDAVTLSQIFSSEGRKVSRVATSL